MPEFQRRKRRSLTDEQLYEEYHRVDEPKSKKRPAGLAKKGKKPSPAEESFSVNAEPLYEQEQAKSPPRKREERKDELQKKSAPAKSRYPAKAAQTRKKRGKMTLYYVLIGVVVIAAVSILSVTVLFNITAFVVEGETAYSDEQIIAASGIDIGDNLLRANIGSAEERIVSSLVYIDSASISRGFPNRLVITVEPAKPVLSFASRGSYYTISERGRLLEIGEISADCPVVTGWSPSGETVIGAQLEDSSDGKVAIALQMIAYMKEYGLNDGCSIDLSDTLNIRMTYDNRIEMELGASTRLEDKFYHAGLLLDGEITATERCTLILSNPDRVVKRPIYDSDADDGGYVVTEPPEEEPDDGYDDGDSWDDGSNDDRYDDGSNDDWYDDGSDNDWYDDGADNETNGNESPDGQEDPDDDGPDGEIGGDSDPDGPSDEGDGEDAGEVPEE